MSWVSLKAPHDLPRPAGRIGRVEHLVEVQPELRSLLDQLPQRHTRVPRALLVRELEHVARFATRLGARLLQPPRAAGMAMQDDHRPVALMPAAKLDAARAEARCGDLRADAVVGSGAVILTRGAEVAE